MLLTRRSCSTKQAEIISTTGYATHRRLHATHVAQHTSTSMRRTTMRRRIAGGLTADRSARREAVRSDGPARQQLRDGIPPGWAVVSPGLAGPSRRTEQGSCTRDVSRFARPVVSRSTCTPGCHEFNVVADATPSRCALRFRWSMGLAGCGDAGHGFAGGEPQLGERPSGVPGVEGFEVEGEVFAGVAAAQRLPNVFAGHVEHHPAKQ